MNRFSLLFLAACGRAAGAPDAPGGDPDAALAPDAAVADAAAPDADPYAVPIGTVDLAGSCTYTHRGWHIGQTHECVRDMTASMSASTRTITVAQTADGYAVTTTLRNPTDPYTTEVGPLHPSATVGIPGCDPIYGTCYTHVWTLAPHSLSLATTQLHDNDSGTAIPQCWEYHYENTACSFALTW